MPKRYFEMESDSADESWRRIRSLRSSPPVSMPLSRRRLFSSALEQAQQQFEAASSVGYESRALNLYYGLSQAGRAIAAAMTPEGSGKTPEVSGHGLKVLHFQSMRSGDLWATGIRSEGNEDTSFGRLASLLRSESLRAPVTLGAIWHMLPEVYFDYPVGSFGEPRWADKPFMGQEAQDPNAFTFQATQREIADDASELKLLYPDLAEARLLRFGGSSYSALEDGTRTDEAVFTYDGPSRLRQLRNSKVLMPAVAPGAGALDPLLAWWVLLYSLSMITRYKPVLWTQVIDVNSSSLAVPMEAALGKALEAIPAHIYATLTGSALRE
ncbi:MULTISPECIES: YaaC family protein [Paenarthrobacter]|uniref:YaaC family protein n=1 Tax=Paenarthrobacter TaxID=1742992 RepID=UPI000A9731AA|nr:hypothetical protein [Paenarthrobacter ureafaciens]RWW91387.1 hypothetical protein AUR_19935 [Paenarthrobacter ureafaciens]